MPPSSKKLKKYFFLRIGFLLIISFNSFADHISKNDSNQKNALIMLKLFKNKFPTMSTIGLFVARNIRVTS